MDIDKKIRITPGLIISLLIILIPSFAWIISFDFGDRPGIEIFGLAMEKTAAFAGMAMFAWSLVLAGRYKFLDNWFRGLDKMYIAHRFFGTASVALLLMHPLGNTVVYISQTVPGAFDLILHFVEIKDVAVTLGRVSLYGLVLVGIWSIFAKVKHETFIAVHRWLGLLFIVGAAHAFMLTGSETSVLGNNQFMWWFMMILSVWATVTFIHFSLLNNFLHKYYTYRVVSNDVLPGTVYDIVIEPKYRIANFKPGQFFYVSFSSLGIDDYHPYSVASSKDDAKLRFIVKDLGDYTAELKQVKPGDIARVKGPYGGFTFNDPKHPKQLWIAGGIGVTPFISKAHSLRFSRLAPHITMLHFARNEAEAIDTEQLDMIQRNHRAFDYTCITEDKFGIVSLKDIAEQLGGLDDYAIYMCGPPGMLKAYEQQAIELGVDKQLYYEEFTY